MCSQHMLLIIIMAIVTGYYNWLIDGKDYVKFTHTRLA